MATALEIVSMKHRSLTDEEIITYAKMETDMKSGTLGVATLGLGALAVGGYVIGKNPTQSRRKFFKTAGLAVPAAAGLVLMSEEEADAFFGLIAAFVAGVFAYAAFSNSRSDVSYEEESWSRRKVEAVSWNQRKGGTVEVEMKNPSNKTKMGKIEALLKNSYGEIEMATADDLRLKMGPHSGTTITYNCAGIPSTGQKNMEGKSQFNSKFSQNIYVA